MPNIILHKHLKRLVSLPTLKVVVEIKIPNGEHWQRLSLGPLPQPGCLSLPNAFVATGQVVYGD